MITESMAIQGLHVISLAAKRSNPLRTVSDSFASDSSSTGLLTVFAMISLIIAVILLFWVFTKYRRSENRLNLRITELTVTNIKLRQENAKLTANNEKLQQENVELYQKQVEVLENVVHEETPRK